VGPVKPSINRYVAEQHPRLHRNLQILRWTPYALVQGTGIAFAAVFVVFFLIGAIFGGGSNG
jgi:hypothetical protein